MPNTSGSLSPSASGSHQFLEHELKSIAPKQNLRRREIELVIVKAPQLGEQILAAPERLRVVELVLQEDRSPSLTVRPKQWDVLSHHVNEDLYVNEDLSSKGMLKSL